MVRICAVDSDVLCQWGVTLLHRQIHSTQHGVQCFVYTEYKHVACKIPTAAKLIRRNKQDDILIPNPLWI